MSKSPRDLKALSKQAVPPVVKLDWEVDVWKLRRFYLENRYKGVDDFGAEVSAAVLDGAQYLEAPPEEYWPLSLTRLSDEAQALQSRLDEERGIPWQEHQKTLNARRRLRAMFEKNEDYDPVVDERNYTNLVPAADGHYIGWVIHNFEAAPGRTRFTKLAAGEAIHPHVDSVPAHIVRAIIPVWTNEESYNGYRVHGEDFEVHLEVGKVYIINAGLPHWAYNHGEEDRLHLIVTLDGLSDIESPTAQPVVNSVNRMGIRPPEETSCIS